MREILERIWSEPERWEDRALKGAVDLVGASATTNTILRSQTPHLQYKRKRRPKYPHPSTLSSWPKQISDSFFGLASCVYLIYAIWITGLVRGKEGWVLFATFRVVLRFFAVRSRKHPRGLDDLFIFIAAVRRHDLPLFIPAAMWLTLIDLRVGIGNNAYCWWVAGSGIYAGKATVGSYEIEVP